MKPCHYILPVFILPLFGGLSHLAASPPSLRPPNEDMDGGQADQHLHIADSLKTAGQYDSATVYYALVVKQSEAAGEWTTCIKALAGWCANESQRGDNLKAVPLGVRAVEVGTRELGKMNVDVGIAYYVAAYAYLGTSKYPEALSHFETSIAILDSVLDENDIRFAEAYEGFSQYYDELGDYDKRIELLHKVLSIRQQNPDKQVAQVAITYSNLGLAYRDKGHNRKATEYLTCAVEHQLRHVGELHPHTALMYNNLGLSFFYGGDNQRALDNYRKCLSIYASLGGDNPRAAYAQNNIAMSYRLEKNFKAALDHGIRSRDLFAGSLGADHPTVAGIVNNLGRTYFDMGNYRKAEESFRSALGMWRSKLGDKHPLVAQSFYNLSDVAAKGKSYDLALSLLDSSLQIRTSVLGERHPKIAEALRAQGNVHAAQGKYDNALRSYQQALMVLVEGFTDSSIQANPALEQVEPRTLLLGTLASKAEVLVKRNSAGDLEAAVDTYHLAARLIGRLRQGFSTEGAKLYLTSESFGVLEKGIGAALRLHAKTNDSTYLHLAFEFAEMGKAGMLSEALAEANARTFAGIPDSLLDAEQSLRDDIAFLDTQVQKQRQTAGRDSAQLRVLEVKLFDATRTYERLIARFEKEYPSYYELKLPPTAVSVKRIQESALGNGEALVEYVAGDSVCFIFVVTKDGIDVNTVRHKGKLTANVLAFRNALRNLDIAAYTRNAYELYRTLVAPVRGKLAGMSKLVIIPDGVLHHVPFEALLMKRAEGSSPDFPHLPYLIFDFEMRYHASAAMLTSEVKREIEERSDAGFAGLAPVFPDGDASRGAKKGKKGEFAVTTRAIRLDGATYPALPATEDEVRGIARLFEEHRQPATMYLRGKASESVLKDPSLRRHAYLHIASHGFINETSPKLSGLLFARDGRKEDGVLYTGETYNLNLDADLVVLSACESGLGKVVRGEGILGLTRGFLYAGARNIVVSLWQVADKSTAELMIAFYTNVLNGQPYATALRNAKLQIIRDVKYSYPLEWGPFVLLGR